MSFRHFNREQNKALSDLLFSAAKTLGAAAMIALFFPAAAQEWTLHYLLGALIGVLLLALLGLSVVGRVGDEMDRPGSRRKGGNKEG